tara:strand:- start:293 stop:523 length:231 start_codon:yes stop_codon:yes gene_type:complete
MLHLGQILHLDLHLLLRLHHQQQSNLRLRLLRLHKLLENQKQKRLFQHHQHHLDQHHQLLQELVDHLKQQKNQYHQ